MMDALITGEDDGGVGISVIDNNDVEHLMSVDFDGEITYHEQDGYPDKAAERSWEGSESIAEARLYAKYTVYRERGYQTLEPHRNPDRIAGTLVAVANLSDERFEDLFGEYCQQHAHHFQEYVDPVIEPPVDSEAGGFLRYELDVYLGLADHLEGSLSEFFGEDVHEVTEGLVETLEAERAQFDPETDLEIDAVSDLRIAYQDGPGDEETIGGSSPLERPPDSVIELVPQPFLSPEASRALLVHHLACQIRDCYLEMGVEPPAAYRLLGHGFYESAQRYRLLDRYEEYFDFDADIPGYRTIDLGHDLETANQTA